MNELRQYLKPIDVDCVVYHNPCCDGFGGAYVFWKYSREYRILKESDYSLLSDSNVNESDILFVPYSHTHTESELREKVISKITGRNTVFIDVCPSENLFMEMLQAPAKAIVLDHHDSALKVINSDKVDKQFAQKRCYIDKSHSGCVLAHQYCFGETSVPLFLSYIEDRDTYNWIHEEYSKPFTEAFYTAVPFDFMAYSAFEDTRNVYSLIDEGKILLKYKDLRVMDLAKKAVEGELKIGDNTYAVYVINTSEHISELGHVLAQSKCERLDKQCDFAIIWYYDEKAQKIKVSLRSDGKRSTNEQTNVSDIARIFGGGGHRNASGFSIEQPDVFWNALRSMNNETKFAPSGTHTKLMYKLRNSSIALLGGLSVGALCLGWIGSMLYSSVSK